MIHRKTIPNGVRLTAQPFSSPNRNANCSIVAEVTSKRGDRRDARLTIMALKWIKLSDVSILTIALRAVMEEAQRQMEKVQEKAAKPSGRRKTK